MKKVYILFLGLAFAPATMAFDGGGMPFNPGLMMYNQAGMSSMHNMNMLNDQRYRKEMAEDWADYKNPKKSEPKIEDETTMQKLFNSRKSKNAEFVQENGELKIEHLE